MTMFGLSFSLGIKLKSQELPQVLSYLNGFATRMLDFTATRSKTKQEKKKKQKKKT